MAPHSSTFAWKTPWKEEPGRLQFMGSLESDTTEWLHFHFSFSCIGEGNGNPLQCSCLENPRDGEAWWAAIYGVAQSRTQLKQLGSSSNMNPPRVYTCSPSWTPLPPPSPSHPSGPSQCTLSHASNLDWRSVLHMIIYMFQYYSLKSSHLHLLPQSKSLFFTSVSLLLSHL